MTVTVLLESLEEINLRQPLLRRTTGSCAAALLVCWETANAGVAGRTSVRGSLLLAPQFRLLFLDS